MQLPHKPFVDLISMLRPKVLSIIILAIFSHLIPLRSQSLTADQAVDFHAPISVGTIDLLIEQSKFKEAHAVWQTVNQDRIAVEFRDYYNAVFAVRLNNNSKLATSFIFLYPKGPIAEQLIEQASDHFFVTGDFAQAHIWLSKSASKDELSTYRAGYLAYRENDFEVAIKYLTSIQSISQYYAQAAYYLGAMYFDRREIAKAKQSFVVASLQEELAAEAAPFLAKLYFEGDAYQQAIKVVDDHLAHSIRFNQIQLLLIRGLSYKSLGESQLAIIDLETAININRRSVDNSVVFDLANLYLNAGELDLAIKWLIYIVSSKSDFEQQASVLLGDCYARKEEWNKAFDAYTLSKNGTIEEISKHALLQQAKVSFKLEQYSTTIDILTDYRAKYHDDKNPDITTLLSQSFVMNDDYVSIIETLGNETLQSTSARKLFQLANYQLAIRQFNDQSFEESLSYLTVALKYPVDLNLVAKSQLLKAEILSYSEAYEASLPYYRSALKGELTEIETSKALYGLGYAQFNLRNYAQARSNFDKVGLNKLAPNFSSELLARQADCDFMVKDFGEAIAKYLKLLNTNQRSYALYQLGSSYKSIGDYGNALTYLGQFLRENSTFSSYRVTALMHQGRTHIALTNWQKAIDSYSLLLSENTSIENSPDALIGIGVAAANLKSFELAESSFKRVIDEFPSSERLKDALFGLQNLNRLGHSIVGFDQYIDKLEQLRPNSDAVAELMFERAKAAYFEQKYESAVVAFESFLQKYPRSTNVESSYYLIGDSYYRLMKWDNAIGYFDRYINSNDLEFQSRSYRKRGEAMMTVGNFKDAVANYSKWSNESQNERDLYFAKLGLAKARYAMEDWQAVLTITKELNVSKWKPIGGANEISLMRSEAFLKQEDLEQAADELLQVVNASNNVQGAEALFKLSELLSSQEKYAESNETLLELLINYKEYAEWTDAAYDRLIQNYLFLGNYFQARATIESILSNSTNEDLKAAARLYMKQIDEMAVVSKIDSIKSSDNED
ncbi:MAG: tetratricopeptide (TPR) repeat protein [Cyclobacteriaceae bacterium]|jgi:tetratricopeptide (TPR) repeat protein